MFNVYKLLLNNIMILFSKCHVHQIEHHVISNLGRYKIPRI